MSLEFAKTDAEAAARYNLWKSKDPFPKIPPALLNSADILDYVATTGMIHPFELGPEREKSRLKPASYEVGLSGTCVHWDSNGDKQEVDLSAGKKFRLEPNSIAFVTLEPMFRLPDYIALRFNLKIRNVYRGLLLGTGPLVDPGFCGRLYIPLHNLTTNRYDFVGGETIIWMEFTKLSPNPCWESESLEHLPRAGVYHPFPPRKLERDSIADYIQVATEGKPVRSSIPDALESARTSARRAERNTKIVGAAVGIGIIALAAAVGSLLFSTWSFFRDERRYFEQLTEALAKRVATVEKSREQVEQQLGSLDKDVREMRDLLSRSDSKRLPGGREKEGAGRK